MHLCLSAVFCSLLCSLAVLGGTARADSPAAGSAVVGNTIDGTTSAALASARNGDWSKGLCPCRAEPGSAHTEARALARLFARHGRQHEIRRYRRLYQPEPGLAVAEENAPSRRTGECRRRRRFGCQLVQAAPADQLVPKARAAEIAIKRSEIETGTAALRKAWIEEDFGPFDERGLLARQGGRLRAEDHQARLDRLLWEGQADAAKRILPLVSADYRALAEARLAFSADSSVGRPSWSPRSRKRCARIRGWSSRRPGLLRKKDRNEGAAELLLGISAPTHPAVYWEERLTLSRRLMTSGNIETAYHLVFAGSAGRR